MSALPPKAHILRHDGSSAKSPPGLTPSQPSTSRTQVAATIEQAVTRVVPAIDVDQGIELDRRAFERLGGLYSDPDFFKNKLIVEIGDSRVLIGETNVGPNLQIVFRAESIHFRKPRLQVFPQIDLEGQADDLACGIARFQRDQRMMPLRPFEAKADGVCEIGAVAWLVGRGVQLTNNDLNSPSDGRPASPPVISLILVFAVTI